jgi:hypothetical protein
MVCGAKVAEITVTEKFPGATLLKENWPLSSEVVIRSEEQSDGSNSTFAPVTTAPVASTMVPLMLPKDAVTVPGASGSVTVAL